MPKTKKKTAKKEATKKKKATAVLALEQEAGQLQLAGKTRAALQKLEEAIELEKKWYHFHRMAE